MERDAVRTRLWSVIALLSSASRFAPFCADSQTNVISGVVSNWAGDNFMTAYYVGRNTALDVLRTDSGGLLAHEFTFIGFEASASNNAILVTG